MKIAAAPMGTLQSGRGSIPATSWTGSQARSPTTARPARATKFPHTMTSSTVVVFPIPWRLRATRPPSIPTAQARVSQGFPPRAWET